MTTLTVLPTLEGYARTGSLASYAACYVGAGAFSASNANRPNATTGNFIMQGFATYDLSALPVGSVVQAAYFESRRNTTLTTGHVVQVRGAYNYGASVSNDDYRTAAQLAALTLLASINTDSMQSSGVNSYFNPTAALEAACVPGSALKVVFCLKANADQTLSGSTTVTGDLLFGATALVIEYTAAGSPPVAAFTQSATEGREDLAVQFTDTSTNTPTSWLWEFGDGSTSTSQNPSYTYTTPGIYAVLLTATNADGDDSAASTVQVFGALGTGKMSAAMDGLAGDITTEGIVTQVYAYPVESVTVPCALVGYPTEFDFDVTMGRGSDRLVIPVWFMAGKAGNGDTRDVLSAVMDDATSIKDALDGTHDYGAVRVTDATIEEVVVSGVTYLSARFDVEVLA